jgi:hypothetical protein
VPTGQKTSKSATQRSPGACGCASARSPELTIPTDAITRLAEHSTAAPPDPPAPASERVLLEMAGRILIVSGLLVR